MNNKPFDDGFFAQRAEGNLPFAPDSFLKSPVIKRAGDSWVRPYVNRASIIQKPMKPLSCPTLNSFAAFAGDGESDSDPGVDPIFQFVGPVQQPTVTQLTGVTQPASVTGNSILDSISGLIKGITPAAGSAITAAAAGQSTTQQQQLLKQYLAGKLPGMVLNAQGQVVPASSVPAATSMSSLAPILLGVGGLMVVMMMMGGGGGNRRR